MIKKIRRSISSLTLRAFCRETSNGGMRVRKEGWLFQESQESTLTQSDPSMDDGFNIAAFYVEGQLDFPNKVPENVLQLYHELYDMEQKVKALENEIAVYVMSFQNKNGPPANKRGSAPRRKSTNAQRQCCIPRLLGCPFGPRPFPGVNETNQRKMPTSRPVPLRMTNKRNSVNTAVQTRNSGNRGSRLSKVSWNSKVDVRYIGSDIHSENPQKVPLRETNLQQKTNEELKNVVHLKIKIPKDVLNLTNSDSVQGRKRLENEWDHFNSSVESKEGGETTASAQSAKEDTFASVNPAGQGQTLENRNCTGTSCHSNGTDPPQPLKSNPDTSNIGQMKLENFREKESNTGRNAIVGTSIVHDGNDEITQSVGIPVKPPGKRACDSQGCSCNGSTRNDGNLDKVRQSFDMTESELSILEKTVHNNSPIELKIQTEYGSVNVISHDPDCKCKICETFGSHDESQRKHRGRSDEAAVISKKIIRVHYNGDYRNIVTHTEECGCDICSNIEEHSYKLLSKRASIVSTHRGELVVKNRGVCGCRNCKTVEMGPHVVDVETMLSRTSSHVLDRCYYSDATIPSMQSFPREGITTTDDQAASFSSPPSINSSDLSDNFDSQSPSASDHQVLNAHPGRNLAELHVSHDFEPVRAVNTKKCSRCENDGDLRVPRNARKRMFGFTKPSSAKSSPAGLNTSKQGKDNECQHCTSCKYGKGKIKQDKCEPVQMKSRFSTPKNVMSTRPLERVPIIDDGEPIQSNKAEVFLNEQKAGNKMSNYNADHVTLEDLIRDLIRGQPGTQKDKVYRVTLGEVANKAYTKIHIVDCSSKSEEVRKNETKPMVKEHVKMPNGDASNSNVFFIKPLPSSTDESQRHSELPNFGESQNKNATTDNRSLSSPARLEDVTKHHLSTNIDSLEERRNLVKTTDGIQEIRIARSTSDTCPRSDMPRRAVKLTISFGKKVASFFRQRGKKKTISANTLLADYDVAQDNPKCLKTFTIYEGVGEHTKPVELLQIDVKPRYFTLETNSGGEDANGPFKQSPILCLLEKNSHTQVVATIAR